MPADLRSILKLEVPVIVQIGSRQMKVREVLELAPGAILELPKDADSHLEVFVNNKSIGLGTAVKVGENFGLRISYVGDLKQRIEAMRQVGAAAPDPAPPEDDHRSAEPADDTAVPFQRSA